MGSILYYISAGIYLLKVNNRPRCEICSKLTIKTPERRYWHRSGVFIVNFEHAFADWDIFAKVSGITLW